MMSDDNEIARPAVRATLGRIAFLKAWHQALQSRSRLYLRLTAWTSPARELRSVIRLIREKGFRSAILTERAIAAADKSLHYTPFSLKTHTFRALARTLPEDVENVLEFGSGNSTVALAALLRSLGVRNVRIVTFENDKAFFDRAAPAFRDYPSVEPLLVPLKRLSEADEAEWLRAPDTVASYNAYGAVETREVYAARGTAGMFYSYDFRQLAGRDFDLVVLDGLRARDDGMRFRSCGTSAGTLS